MEEAVCSVEDGLLRRGLEVLSESIRSDLTATLSYSPLQTIREPLSEERRQAAVHAVELLVVGLVRQLANCEDLELAVPKASQWDGSDATGSSARVRFDAPSSQRRFTIMVMLVARVHKLLTTRSSGTRRQFYYEEVSFLKSQREVDDGVLGVSRVVGLPPWQLGLFATAKGLVAGDVVLKTIDGEELDCRNTPGGVLIPGNAAAILDIKSTARFVLVLEKDTIFQRVLQEGVLGRLGPCIIVTGKGYPDVSTRVLLARLEAELKLPILAVVDADPHGVHIMSVYRFGSKTCPLPLRSLRWLGLLPSEICSLSVKTVPLTDRDVALARSLLQKDFPAAVRAELETLLAQGTKAEVDALMEFSPCYITDVYLPNKIASANAL